MIALCQLVYWRAAMWAGVISLDITGVGPLMVSQPMVTGPIFGWIMGQVRVGVIIGGIVQLLWMDVSPVGVGIPFDATAVTVLAVYWASLQPDCPVSHMVLALVLAVPFGYVFSFLDTHARKINTWIARRLESVSDKHLPWALDLGIAAGLAWSWLRYAVFYAVAMLAGEVGLRWLATQPVPPWLYRGMTVAAVLLPVAGLGVALELFLTDEPERRISSFRVFKPR